MNPFPGWIQALPEVETPLTGMHGHLLASSQGQTVFFYAEGPVQVPAHHHGAQWGIVVAGELTLTIAGTTRRYRPGDSYHIASGEEHAASLLPETAIVDVFAAAGRYQPRGK